MLALLLRMACLSVIVAGSGCAMCSSCDDFTYSANGGRWERLDPGFGRVGSAFTPEVGVEVGDTLLETTETPEDIAPPEPTPADSQPQSSPNDDAVPTPQASVLHPSHSTH